MLRSSLFDDPFFMGQGEQMRQMDDMFASAFGGRSGGMMALPNAGWPQRQQQQAQNMQVADRRQFMDPFSHFDSMFSNMRSMMSDMHRAFESHSSDPNAQVFQQSSYMTYSNSGNGAPRYYQASSSTHQGPGGVRETKKTVRDSESGVEKIAVGHHIHDRGHVVERSRNKKTGEANENQEYMNLNEEEAPQFDQEYQEKWRSTMRGLDDRRRAERLRHAPVRDNHRSRRAALPEPEGRYQHRSNRRE